MTIEYSYNVSQPMWLRIHSLDPLQGVKRVVVV